VSETTENGTSRSLDHVPCLAEFGSAPRTTRTTSWFVVLVHPRQDERSYKDWRTRVAAPPRPACYGRPRVETEIGHYVVRAWVTEGIRSGVVACSHHMGPQERGVEATGHRQM